jgi:mono/diheme cytochrome c family protein
MNEAISLTHRIVVTLFFLIYVVKTVLLLSNKNDLLQKFTKAVKVPEMIVSFLFLATGVYLLTLLPVIKVMMWVKIGLVFASIPLAVIGFKKQNKVLAALSLLMITASYGIAEAEKKKREKGETVVAGNINGKEIYDAKCMLCHGGDGKAKLNGAADLSATVYDVAAIKNVVMNGQKTMVPISDLSPEQAEAVAAYVESSIKGK